jgi:hypothetical protein
MRKMGILTFLLQKMTGNLFHSGITGVGCCIFVLRKKFYWSHVVGLLVNSKLPVKSGSFFITQKIKPLYKWIKER